MINRSVDNDDDQVDGARLRLWTATTNGSAVRVTRSIYARITMVEWYGQDKTPGSSTRALWQSYPQSSSNKAELTGEGKNKFCLTKNFWSYIEGIFNMP
jgi:hypothetical protein